jgi:hypothetical protein
VAPGGSATELAALRERVRNAEELIEAMARIMSDGALG